MSEQIEQNVIDAAVPPPSSPNLAFDTASAATEDESTWAEAGRLCPDPLEDGAFDVVPLPLPHRVNVLGVNVSVLTVSELHQQIAHAIRTNQKRLVLHANVHGINLCFKHKWLAGIYNNAPIVFCDGSGVRYGARLLGHDIPERITYADWVWQLADFAAQNGFSIFCLGAKPHVIDKAVAALQSAQPSLKIAGSHHGHFDKEPACAANQQVVELINRAQPDILLVGFGMPLQEQWLQENWDAIDANIALTGGAVFDYASGELQRAPKWILNLNMEWLGRLWIEPRRLAKRYLVGNPLFLGRILVEMVRQRLSM